MSSLRNIVLGCVSEHGQETPEPSNFSPPKRLSKVKFGVPLVNTLVDGELPEPLVNIIVYIARDGVATSDLFRRPGSHTDLKVIVRRLADGIPIQLSDYNFYTLASVIKMFLLKIPGGLFGGDIERRLLEVLELNGRLEQCDAIHCVVASLPLATQRLIALLFGTWFRVVNHCEYNAMTSEAMAKSIAGSIFHTCATQPSMVNDAVRLIRIIIDNFGAQSVLGAANVSYFTEQTCTAIKVRERFKYQLSGTCPVLTTDSPGTDGAGGRTGTIRVDFSDECRRRFARVVASDARCRGFNPTSSVVSENEFYSGYVAERPASTHELYSSRRISAEVNSTSMSEPGRPSPSLSLCMPNNTAIDDHEAQHSKLTHVSSLSAPDVNQGCSDSESMQNSPSPCNPSYVSASLHRFDSVKRRQLQRLRKRSDWFLSPPSKSSSDRSDDEQIPASAPERVRFHGIVETETAETNEFPTELSQLPKLCVRDFDSSTADNGSFTCDLGRRRPSDNDDHLLHTTLQLNDRLSSARNSSSNYSDDLSANLATNSPSNCLPLSDDVASSVSVTTEDILNQSADVHYFVVDHYYGNSNPAGVIITANGGDGI